MSTKMSRKDLIKRDDAFLSAAGQSVDWAQKHRMTIIGVVVGVIVVVGAVVGVSTFSRAKDKEASELYFAALKIKDAQINAEPAKDADAPSYKDEATRNAAARDAFQKVVDTTPRSGVARLARLHMGELNMQLGDTDKAMANFTELRSSLSAKDSLYFLATERLAYAQEQKGDTEAALATWKTLITDKKSFYGDRALYETARLHADRGEGEKAKSSLDTLDKLFPETNLKEKVKELSAAVGRTPSEPTASAAKAP